jgi:4-hydroxyacetophenone monooxygenase
VVTEDELREHLPSVDTPLLLLSAVHATRDTTLLDRFADRVGPPRGNVRGAVDTLPHAGSVEAHAQLTEVLVAALTKQDQPDYLGVGDQRAVPPTTTPPQTLNVAIIGAGMTGLDAAVKASDRGFGYEVFDMAAGIGGLWWSQSYPGVAVDTPSVYYSLSYEMTPDWSKHFPTGEEYQAYLTNLATKYELTDRLHFNSRVTRMEWLDTDQVWELTILDTVEHTARTVRAAAVITAAGHLNRPKYQAPGRPVPFEHRSGADHQQVPLDDGHADVPSRLHSSVDVVAA